MPTRAYFDKLGIIPAHAGNTFPRRAPRPSRRDHPRACGEHVAVARIHVIPSGSSPRMRGTLMAGSIGGLATGIIPAHAGNTAITSCRYTRWRDHPRACGEHGVLKSTDSPLVGSSPRMRGTLGQDQLLRIVHGIIPAHAGNTALLLIAFIALRGSSPRMRGTHPMQRLSGRCYGIIPAHAGNTFPNPRTVPWSGDHPRACGEHGDLVVESRGLRGSSPRMRGTQGTPVRTFSV